MKRSFIVSALLLFAATAYAQSNPVLKNDMQQLGTLFTDIHTNISNPAMSGKLAGEAGQMVTIFTDALNVVPAKISALPAAQQAAAIADYQAIIQDEITNATALQAAFVKGDLTTAQSIYTKMNQDKNQGHSKYKP